MYVLTTVKNLNILFNEKPEKKKKKRHRNGYKGMPQTCKGNIQEIITSNKKKMCVTKTKQ